MQILALLLVLGGEVRSYEPFPHGLAVQTEIVAVVSPVPIVDEPDYGVSVAYKAEASRNVEESLALSAPSPVQGHDWLDPAQSVG
jgi:hypothetical protein